MYKRIQIPIYEQDLHICVFKTVKKAHDFLLKKNIDCEFDDNDFESTKAITVNDLGTDGIILIITEEDLTYGTISHETDHIVEYMMKYVGIKKTEASAEAFSYLNGYLVKTISTIIKAKGYKIND